MAGSILGNRVLRKEDPKFLTTGGVYVDDMVDEPLLDGALHVTYVRSSVAHATITSIDTSEALASPGVVAVLTAEDLDLQPIPATYNPMVARTLLASDKVRYVGEPIAVILTERANQGEDAAERVIVDYDVLEAYVDMESAMAPGALPLYEAVGSNVVVDSTVFGMPGIADDAFDGCEVVVRARINNQRVAPCPLEVRGSAATWHEGRLIQWISSQHAQGAKSRIAGVLGVDPETVRIITPDVGGGFGAKIDAYPEEILLGMIAKHCGKPVRWRETRSESMVALGHGRAQLQDIAIGGTRDGRVLAYTLKVYQDAGAFVDIGSILAPFMTRPMASGVYAIPRIDVHTVSVTTNTTPTVAYRGAGRPEATAAIERAMDMFAAELGMDPAEVRRKNLIPKFMEPHTTAIGQTYDVGDYEVALDKALNAANYKELRAEQARRRSSGDVKQLGIGVSVYVEITGGVPPMGDTAKVEITDDGRAIVYTGTSPHGQGHATAWSMLTSEQTGIPMENVELVWGDTDLVPSGGGTMGSRSLQQGGVAVFKVAGQVVDKAKAVAARLLEANEEDIVLDRDRGAFHVAGTPAVAKTWAELAVAAKADGGLRHEEMHSVASATFPFGAHVSVVEVDTETGKVSLIKQIACDDAGKVLNPLLLDGQIHGGVAQGAAQALLE
ncbi:MAG: xanthine dehydrogenase family protein molybdopterin-binding subunit, partial [Actinomycetota bacterium]